MELVNAFHVTDINLELLHTTYLSGIQLVANFRFCQSEMLYT